MPRYDVTIYLPWLSRVLERGLGSAAGAERQVGILARELVRRDVRVAVVVYPVDERSPEVDPRLVVVERGPHAGSSGLVNTIVETARVLWALLRADASVFVVRTGTPVVGVIALYCRVRRRKLVFSSAHNLDFMPRDDPVWRRRRGLYRLGVKLANAVVVQSRDQTALAREAYPGVRDVVHIPSFADTLPEPRECEPSVFLWVGRLVGFKRPLLFAQLAEAVPEASFALVPFVGDNPSEEASLLLTPLREAAARLPNFELRRPLPHAELMELLPTAVALVSTSESEGMPNTFLEGWTLGVPVLSLSFDPDNVITERGLGVATADSWDDFVAAAADMWHGRFEREAAAERARRYIAETHSVNAVAGAWMDMLARLDARVRD